MNAAETWSKIRTENQLLALARLRSLVLLTKNKTKQNKTKKPNNNKKKPDSEELTGGRTGTRTKEQIVHPAQ